VVATLHTLVHSATLCRRSLSADLLHHEISELKNVRNRASVNVTTHPALQSVSMSFISGNLSVLSVAEKFYKQLDTIVIIIIYIILQLLEFTDVLAVWMRL